MARTYWIAAAMVAALASCSKPTPGRSDKSGGNAVRGNAAATAPATASSAGTPGRNPLNPGEWETSVEVKMAGLPANLPPEAAKAMHGMKMVTRHCLTPEEAAKPSGDVFSGKDQKNCTRQDWTMSGGRLHGALVCKGSGSGTTTTMALDGQYGGDSFDVTMVMTGDHGGQSMHMESHSVGRRVADVCSAASKND